jgi:DnaK suppressor protein
VNFEQTKKLLQEEIEKTLQEIELLKESVKPVSPDNAIGRLSRMEAINAKSVSEENLRQSELRITKLKAAIQRCNDGEYGICLSCEEEISEKRLNSIPEATLCIRCATGQE